ncbi:acylneuraminate cytidylyltransferase family protein [Roseobacter sp. HKCCD7870]|uniref:acylneuraminate cytidylyltransferase family protein n=1 Tax=Roseobacter sp. HKCCD7870 TaxID=3120343 RepID=UPI0040407CCC
MDILVVVPARGGSKRLPGKNLRLLGTKSLIGWTAEAIESAGLSSCAVLSTDDPLIAAEGRRFGLTVPFLRPPELSTDDAPTVDTVLHALTWRRAQFGHDPEAVLVLQPTSPLRGFSCILAAISLLSSRPDVNSVISMNRHDLPRNAIFFPANAGGVEPLGVDVRSPVYLPNGAVYLTRTAALRASRSIYADPIVPLEIDPRRTVDVDTELDWQIAEAFLAAGLPPEAEARATSCE